MLREILTSLKVWNRCPIITDCSELFIWTLDANTSLIARGKSERGSGADVASLNTKGVLENTASEDLQGHSLFFCFFSPLWEKSYPKFRLVWCAIKEYFFFLCILYDYAQTVFHSNNIHSTLCKKREHHNIAQMRMFAKYCGINKHSAATQYSSFLDRAWNNLTGWAPQPTRASTARRYSPHIIAADLALRLWPS